MGKTATRWSNLWEIVSFTPPKPKGCIPWAFKPRPLDFDIVIMYAFNAHNV